VTMQQGSLIPWVAAPISEASCLEFLWLGNLGFSLIFIPLFAKTWRIYLIFSRAQLKVLKMSNQKLLMLVSALMLIDIALLAAWTGASPFGPVEILRNVGGSWHSATMCGLKDSKANIFIILIAVYKGALLVFGSLMAFATRRVQGAFNESQAIAWSVYNVLFSSILLGAIIYFVDAFEDTLILLVMFLGMWTCIVPWALLFLPKVRNNNEKSKTEKGGMKADDETKGERGRETERERESSKFNAGMATLD
jgi:hypothetical protein